MIPDLSVTAEQDGQAQELSQNKTPRSAQSQSIQNQRSGSKSRNKSSLGQDQTRGPEAMQGSARRSENPEIEEGTYSDDDGGYGDNTQQNRIEASRMNGGNPNKRSQKQTKRRITKRGETLVEDTLTEQEESSDANQPRHKSPLRKRNLSRTINFLFFIVNRNQ